MTKSYSQQTKEHVYCEHCQKKEFFFLKNICQPDKTTAWEAIKATLFCPRCEEEKLIEMSYPDLARLLPEVLSVNPEKKYFKIGYCSGCRRTSRFALLNIEVSNSGRVGLGVGNLLCENRCCEKRLEWHLDAADVLDILKFKGFLER